MFFQLAHSILTPSIIKFQRRGGGVTSKILTIVQGRIYKRKYAKQVREIRFFLQT